MHAYAVRVKLQTLGGLFSGSRATASSQSKPNRRARVAAQAILRAAPERPSRSLHTQAVEYLLLGDIFQPSCEKDLPGGEVAYVIAAPCIGTKDNSCVEVCPVDCIHPTPGRSADYPFGRDALHRPRGVHRLRRLRRGMPWTQSSPRTSFQRSGGISPR